MRKLIHLSIRRADQSDARVVILVLISTLLRPFAPYISPHLFSTFPFPTIDQIHSLEEHCPCINNFFPAIPAPLLTVLILRSPFRSFVRSKARLTLSFVCIVYSPILVCCGFFRFLFWYLSIISFICFTLFLFPVTWHILYRIPSSSSCNRF